MDEPPTKTLHSLPGSAPRRVSLVLLHRQRARVVPLQPGVPLIVGRGQRADLTVEDETISRQHTRFELGDEGLDVEDLGSKNGTLVNGQPIRRAALEAGDKVTIGAAAVTVHAEAPSGDEIPGVESYDRFCAVLREEATRVQQTGRPLALLSVRHGGDALPRIVDHTGPYDRVAAHSAREAVVLLLDASHERAERFARALIDTAPRAIVCGLARLPQAASTAEALEELARRAARRATAAQPLQWAAAGAEPGGPVVGCAAMERVYATARRLADKALPVLLVGETGTGKELVARAIHRGGPRGQAPLICVNCAAIPQNLIESELFGHERGAFTGATQRAKGVFEEADGGSVFLDEIGELSAAGQAALLRVLDSKRFCRVGSKRELTVDVRVIAATNRDLEAMADEGTFRLDLLHRINAVTLEIPPLRERREEIPVLVDHFVAQVGRDDRCGPKTLAPEALALLLQYDWPGNVRELRNAIERGMALASGPTIEVEHLPQRLLRSAAAGISPVDAPPGAEGVEVERLIAGPRGPGATGFRDFIRRTEAAAIAATLREAGWKKTLAAERLGIPLRTLTDKISAHQIDRRFEGEAELARALERVVPAAAGEGFRQRIQRYEAWLIEQALRRHGGRRHEVASALRIPERTLRDKLRAYGLD